MIKPFKIRRVATLAAAALALSVGAFAIATPAQARTLTPSAAAAQPRLSAVSLHLPFSLSALPAAGSATTSFQIVNYNSGLCLGVQGGGVDAAAVQYNCNGHPDQQWHWGAENSNNPGWFQLVNASNVAGGVCLGVQGGSTALSAAIVGWHCLGSNNTDQYWQNIPDTCSGAVPINNLKSNYVVGVPGNSIANDTKLIQYKYQQVCNNQFWFFG
jgi:hypothetical protein